MSTFFPAGGLHGKPGPWWRVVHSAIEAGADLSALRLIHISGMPDLSEDFCEQMEQHLGAGAACMHYDTTSVLVMEPGISDREVLDVACEVLNISDEQVRLWTAVEIQDTGFKFRPVSNEAFLKTDTPDTASSTAGLEVILTDAEFTYFPLWDIQASEIFGYVCESVWSTETGARVPEESLNSFFKKTRHVLALDREALHKSIAQALDFLDRYMFANIVIPVHYSTITDKDHGPAYMNACNDGIWSVVDNVYFEITKVPADADPALLAQAIEDLTPCGQGVLLRVDKMFQNFGALNIASVLSVGLDFHYDARPQDAIHADLKTFAERAHESGLKCHAHSLSGMETCVVAAECGYAYISSNVIAPPLDLSNPEEEMATPPAVLRAMLKGKE